MGRGRGTCCRRSRVVWGEEEAWRELAVEAGLTRGGGDRGDLDPRDLHRTGECRRRSCCGGVLLCWGSGNARGGGGGYWLFGRFAGVVDMEGVCVYLCVFYFGEGSVIGRRLVVLCVVDQ